MTKPPPGSSPEDRRQSPRIPLEAEVGFASDTNFYTGFSEDISEGGLFVATFQLQPLGTKVDLRFALPNGHEVHIEGVVRWHRRNTHFGGEDADRPGMGIQFSSLSPEDQTVIVQFIAHRNPLFYDD